MARRRDILRIGGLPLMALLAQDKLPIPSGTRSLREVKLNKTAAGDARVYLKGQTGKLKDLFVGSWQVAPGKSPHDIHQHPDEELLVFTEGAGVVTVDGKNSKVEAGSIMYCAGGVPHGVVNTGDVPMSFYFIRWTA